MVTATQEEIHSVPMVWNGEGVLPLAADLASLEIKTHVRTTAQLSENSRLGFASKNLAPHQGSGFVNSTSVLGIEPVFAVEGVRSSSSGRENDGTGLYFYRARYYNPTLQRFVSEDPTGFAAGVNFYAYALNAPTNWGDASGLNVVVQGSQADYQQATNYLSRDPGMSKIIRDLQSSSTTYTVVFNNSGDDSYNPSTHVISWDPNSGLQVTSGGTQTPALGLGHEMAHADAPWWSTLVGWIPLPNNYDNVEEWRDITGPETRAAKTLGEPTRTDHRGDPIPVLNPTSTAGRK